MLLCAFNFRPKDEFQLMAVCILSHGDEGDIIYGVDGKKVDIKATLIETFNTKYLGNTSCNL